MYRRVFDVVPVRFSGFGFFFFFLLAGRSGRRRVNRSKSFAGFFASQCTTLRSTRYCSVPGDSKLKIISQHSKSAADRRHFYLYHFSHKITKTRLKKIKKRPRFEVQHLEWLILFLYFILVLISRKRVRSLYVSFSFSSDKTKKV